MSTEDLPKRALDAARRYASATAALMQARKDNRAIRKACEYWQPHEGPDDNGYPGCAEVPACPWNQEIQPEQWCDTCQAVELPDLGELKKARRRALALLLRLGRQSLGVPV